MASLCSRYCRACPEATKPSSVDAGFQWPNQKFSPLNPP